MSITLVDEGGGCRLEADKMGTESLDTVQHFLKSAEAEVLGPESPRGAKNLSVFLGEKSTVSSSCALVCAVVFSARSRASFLLLSAHNVVRVRGAPVSVSEDFEGFCQRDPLAPSRHSLFAHSSHILGGSFAVVRAMCVRSGTREEGFRSGVVRRDVRVVPRTGTQDD